MHHLTVPAILGRLVSKRLLLVLLSQTESPRRSCVARDSAHGRDSRQDQELSWKTTRSAEVAPDALRPILPIWPACWGTVGDCGNDQLLHGLVVAVGAQERRADSSVDGAGAHRSTA